MKSNRT